MTDVAAAYARNRTVIVSYTDLLGEVETELTPYIGVVANVVDHKPLLEAAMDSFFYGAAAGPSIADMLKGYSLPTDIVRKVERDVTQRIYNIVSSALGIVFPSRNYSYKFVSPEDVAIVETSPIRRTL